MADYKASSIEQKWQQYWKQNQTYKVSKDAGKPSFYVLDMFPYPSGAGLHVGHPLGYIASDIVARKKKMEGFQVLHPMGYDAFGLPAEQYAIKTGQHPAITTEKNIARYREQLDRIGFCYDWSREIRTCQPNYYRWTQWIFTQLYNSWYNLDDEEAESIDVLKMLFLRDGNQDVMAACSNDTPQFTADEWEAMSEQQQEEILSHYRLAYRAETAVNWCPALGTVLANDEVKDGFSVRGGHPVIKKEMMQWSLRITAYADRLLKDLDKVDWPVSVKEIQKNWIGRSEGALMDFEINNHPDEKIQVFTTRPDTIFGVTFIVLAPEHELVRKITTPEQQAEIQDYIEATQRRSERDRMSDVKTVSGAFTGAYVKHPFVGDDIPIWIADYVLAGYGTGAVMAVPSSDTRDYAFATHFNLPVIQVLEGDRTDITKDDFDPKAGTIINSGFLNGFDWQRGVLNVIEEMQLRKTGARKINYRLRDAAFGRQRYWGEPIPVYYDDNNVAHVLPEDELPLVLPEVDEYKPTETGEPPLARAKDWKYKGQYDYEHTTMPGWAGSSWYFLRYMDPHNTEKFVSEEAAEKWGQVDLYIGGSEHATGHLLYARFWTKFLYDLGYIPFEEPFQKMVNQGMIQGRSNLIHREKATNRYISAGLADNYDTSLIHVDVSLINANDELDVEAFKASVPEYTNAEFLLEDGIMKCEHQIEKMSKSLLNVVNPDFIIEEYGADTLRMYEMFLGPLEQSKPWNTHGIEGVVKFLRKFWKLFHDKQGHFKLSNGEAKTEELKILHKTIKKVTEDIDNLSFNTSVSAFMVCVNELTSLKCNNQAVLEGVLKILAPFAPHICEELWQLCGHEESITVANWPGFNEKYLIEDMIKYPVQINGKVRATASFSADLSADEVKANVLALDEVKKWLNGQEPRKVIVVPKRIVNIVL